MEHAIERAASVIDKAMQSAEWRWAEDPDDAPTFLARALAEAGLLALAPLREARYTLICEDGIAHGSYGTAEEAARHADHDAPVMVSYSTGWMRVDRAEGDGRADR